MLDISKDYEAIVIGTSAGGLFALATILQNLPRDYAIPIVVVQHRSKDQRDLFEEVLQSKCEIRIKQADEKESIRNGFIYVAPPDYHLLVETDKTFSLSSDSPVHYSRPSIDVLFESAAIAYREKLIGIILTGANNDGAAGTIAVQKGGGLTIVQNPEEAQFASMIHASIQTRKVQYIWSLSTIGNFLMNIHKT